MRRLVVILSLIVFGVVNANAADAVVIDGKTYVAQVTEDKPDTVVIDGKVYITQPSEDKPNTVFMNGKVIEQEAAQSSVSAKGENEENTFLGMLLLGIVIVIVGIVMCAGSIDNLGTVDVDKRGRFNFGIIAILIGAVLLLYAGFGYLTMYL